MNWVVHNIFIMLYVLPRISECRQELRDFAEAEYGPNGDLTRIQIASYSLVSNMAGKLPNLDQPCLSTFFCDLILTKCQFTKD